MAVFEAVNLVMLGIENGFAVKNFPINARSYRIRY